jgi:hypothetical protein
MKFITPKVYQKSFTCPHCDAIAQQNWVHVNWQGYDDLLGTNPVRIGTCVHCEGSSVWIEDTMFYPDNSNAPSAHEDMPIEVKKVYLEASSIYHKSPRGAAALLRLAIQLLCKELGETGTNINKDIKNLVSKGLPPLVQQSLDIVRVTGNEAVHPGQIDTDDPATVGNLFQLTNIIVEYMISLPKQVINLYGSLPSDKTDAITKRDATK